MLKSYLICVLASSLLLVACVTTNERDSGETSVFGDPLPYEISLDGEWGFVPASNAPESPQLIDQATDQWAKLSVPGNWYLDGYELAGTGFFKTTFRLNSLPSNAHIRLHFEAVDYAADVWVNETWIGRHQGYFDAFSFDISAAINENSINDVTVRVDSPKERPEDWSLNKRLIKGVLSHHDTRPGGAWSIDGQDANTGGIWGSVNVAITHELAIDRIDWHDVIDLELEEASTEVNLVLSEKATVDQHLNLIIQERNRKTGKTQSFQRTVNLAAGENTLNTTLGKRKVDLWQPWEIGEAMLYDYTLVLERKGKQLDLHRLSRGIRHIERDVSTGQWRINGQRIFLRGTNYIPSQWLSEMTEQGFSHDIELMLRANINAVRVHAMVLPQRFYDLANKAGLLVWQDFPLQWGYSDDKTFHAEARRQLTRMIQQLGRHASIIAWSMHNEPPWEASWMKYKYPDYDSNQNRALDQMLVRTARQLDQSRYVHEASLTAEHPWFGWYSGKWQDYAKPTKEPLITEFGAQALPGLDSLNRIFSADQIYPGDDTEWTDWRYRNFQPRETFEIAGVAPGNNITELITNTQAYQARLVQFAAESYRRQRYAPVAGIFQFMFVECWPSVNWGILDYRRNPKPGYEALRLAYQPVLPSIEYSDQIFSAETPVELGLWIVNDLKHPLLQSKLETSLWRNGTLIEENDRQYDIAPDSSTQLEKWRNEGLQPGSYMLRVRLTDATDKVLGTNRFSFTVNQ